MAILKNEVYLYLLIRNNNLDKLGIAAAIISRPGKTYFGYNLISYWLPASPNVGGPEPFY